MLIKNEYLGTIGYLGGLATVHEEFCWSWCQLIQYNYEYFINHQPGKSIYYDRSKISFHAWSRNYLANNMKGDWLLQLDTDHEFAPDILVRMLNAMEKLRASVVTAIYVHRAEPYGPVLYEFDENWKPQQVVNWDRRAKAFQTNCAGAGSLLVKREVFEQIKKELKEDPFDIIHPLGEDFSFFKRLKLLGIKAYAIPAIETYHLQTVPRGLMDYNAEGLPSVEGEKMEGFL